MSTCVITPISAFQSTNLNSKIDCFGRLADRIVRAIGAPLISIEIHQDQIFENIAISCEMFSKFAGYTREYLILDSALYEKGRGIRLDHLYTLANKDLTNYQKLNHITESRDTAPYIENPDTFYISISSLNKNFFAMSNALSGIYTEGLQRNVILDYSMYNFMVSAFASDPALHIIPISNYFLPSYNEEITIRGEKDNSQNTKIYNNMFDYDAMEYRKVAAVVNFEEGSTTGVNTLFTIEQTLAQQTYFSYAMGNYGFDLISWYVLKNWLKDREKLLAQKRYFTFDPRTQYLVMTPPPRTPGSGSRFYGVLFCYVERPLKDIIKEQWVYQYALALSKITVGMIRGKYQGTNLFGGGTINAAILEDGKVEKDKLENLLMQQGPVGFGDAAPPMFFVG
jgi:hypothetical protein